MEVVHTIPELRAAVARARQAGKSVGFVPTMGCLHEGHLSLIRRAKQESGYVVVSIFVNPTQFAAGEDFERYPRTLASDVQLATEAGADIVETNTFGGTSVALGEYDVSHLVPEVCGAAARPRRRPEQVCPAPSRLSAGKAR